jgi:valyl-tRNA synthetase
MHQDEDVLDTWFSSWLWPIAVFDGIRNPHNPEFKYYYPTNDLVTAPEILFFWVARMIIAGYEFVKQKPFHNVYLTGIVRDKLGRKMSKSLGNSPEPLDLIDKYGADGVRVGMLLCSPAGNDLLFDETLPEQGRNFSNKIWNAFRLFKQFIKDEDLSQPAYAKQAVRWFEQCLNKAIINVRDDFSKYRLSEALMEIYRLFWEDFASWYLEIIKPATGKNIDNETYVKTKFFFEQILKLLHPFMPFITEELWHQIETRKEGDTIMRTLYPQAESYDANIISLMQQVKELIGEIRNIRKQKNIQSKDSIELYVKTDSYKLNEFASVICKLANVSDIKFGKPEETSIPFLVGTDEYFIPFKENIDLEEEVSKIQKEIQYYEGFLASVMKKLSNEQFVNKAPKNVVENELSKKRDAEAKLNSLYEQLKSLKELNKA